MAKTPGKRSAAEGAARPRLIIHLGVQKTGTTSVQQFLMLNRAALTTRLVIRVPEAGTPMRPLGRAAVAFSLKPNADAEARLVEAMAVLRDDLPGDHRPVLISHENLAGAMPGNGGETRFYPLLPRILPLLDRTFAPLKPIYVTYGRDMAAWKASVWSQAVRTDGYQRSYAEFLDEVRDLPGWDDLTARLDAVAPGRVHHLRLEDETDPLRPGQQLLRLAGLDSDEIAALQPLKTPGMVRLNAGATEFMRRLNNLPLNPVARAKVADLVSRAQPLFNADHRPEGTL